MRAKHILLLTSLLVAIAVLKADPPRDGEPRSVTQDPGNYRHWRPSTDGRVSVYLSLDKTTFAAAEHITVRCVVRNDSDKPISILGPFADTYFAHSSGLSILGPDGAVAYKGAHKDYVLGSGVFIELPPGKVVEESHAIPKDVFTGIEKPGLYAMDYRYVSAGRSVEPPPANFWTGQVDSNPVTLLVK
jgi:hypothetical protein